MKFITELIMKLEKNNVLMNPCTKTQIEKINSIAQGKELPQAYIEFVSVMGNGTEGKFMGGDSCFMDELDELRQGAVELLAENESENMLTDDDFVFWMSQGCMFCFFNLNDGDNPPVYFYNEDGKDEFIKIANSLTEFFINRLEMNKDLFTEK
ncbi:MAG: SMI1/KNR4 family protein [Lachnospiraceae bacterium]|nr:SMI1/KNR4 family protein [Lachnospiraceae bacterium]